jgi:signal transduction histidine kinase
MVKVLAVDDRPENLLALEGVLASSSYEVVSLRSGEDALRYLLREDIGDLAVILMDVQMPGLNGFQTVELIKQRERCQDIPVIFVTAISTSSEHVRQGYDAGSIDYLFKPIDPDLLRMKVGAFVKLHRYYRKTIEQGEMLRKRTSELEDSNRRFAETDALLKDQNEKLESIVEERTKELLVSNIRLLRSQERFKKMFMSSPCLISIRRLSDLAYIDVNESWMNFTGYGEDAIGDCSNLLQMSLESEGETEFFHDRPMRNVKVNYRTKKEEWRDGLLSTEIIDIEGEKCLLEVIVDVTEKVRYEKEMTRLSELNLVGEMAAGIAHEIRNPMTTIRGFLQLSQNAGGRMDKEHVDMMLEELDRANSIITEYLSLAKNKQSDRRPTSLNRLLDSLYPLIQAEAMMSGKRVQMEFGDCGDIAIDEKEIRQLILNMSLNGLEAMPPGGVLTIRTESAGKFVILRIIDQGSGISKENLEKLGRPFFTTKEQGTGLGLAVCYSIAARHRAAIEVESGPGGTAFAIHFNESDDH